jgi:hypothetical protein
MFFRIVRKFSACCENLPLKKKKKHCPELVRYLLTKQKVQRVMRIARQIITNKLNLAPHTTKTSNKSQLQVLKNKIL